MDTAVSPKWTRYYDEGYSSYYYVNNETLDSQWEEPPFNEGIVDRSGNENQDDFVDTELDDQFQIKYYDHNQDLQGYLNGRAIDGLALSDDEDFQVDGGNIPGETDGEFQQLWDGKDDLNQRLSYLEEREDRTHLVGGRKQDYIGLAVLYRSQRKYADPYADLLCVLCNREYCTEVFFPCEHRCVCSTCIETEKIMDDISCYDSDDYSCNCALCGAIIKKILPAEGGMEVDKYWDWVYEIPVELPRNFMRDFRHSAAIIRSVYVNQKEEEQDDSIACVLS